MEINWICSRIRYLKDDGMHNAVGTYIYSIIIFMYVHYVFIYKYVPLFYKFN